MEIGEGTLDVTNFAWSYTYTDHAAMDISIVGDSVTISNIVNYPTPFSQIRTIAASPIPLRTAPDL
jgi:hypothetical protein